MRVPTVYLETTMFNFPFVDDAPQYKADTLRLFEEIKVGKFQPFTSEYVTLELEAATDALRGERLRLIKDYGITEIPACDEAERLADAYLSMGIIPEKYITDALHIAVATIAGLDCIVSLNFRHIVKHKTILETEYINAREGYKRVFIHTPAEVIDHDENI
jgi:hypothetical protein